MRRAGNVAGPCRAAPGGSSWRCIVVLVGGAIAAGGDPAAEARRRPHRGRHRVEAAACTRPARAALPDPQGALSAFDAAGGSDRGVSKDLHAALDSVGRGAEATATPARRRPPPTRSRRRAPGCIANVLGLRAADGRQGGHRLAWPSSPAPSRTPELVAAYNRAVRAYEDERTGALAQPVARVLGFDARARARPRT